MSNTPYLTLNNCDAVASAFMNLDEILTDIQQDLFKGIQTHGREVRALCEFMLGPDALDDDLATALERLTEALPDCLHQMGGYMDESLTPAVETLTAVARGVVGPAVTESTPPPAATAQ